MSFSITPHRIPLRQDLSGTRSLPVWASLAGQWTSEISLSLFTSSGVTALWGHAQVLCGARDLN